MGKTCMHHCVSCVRIIQYSRMGAYANEQSVEENVCELQSESKVSLGKDTE